MSNNYIIYILILLYNLYVFFLIYLIYKLKVNLYILDKMYVLIKTI